MKRDVMIVFIGCNPNIKITHRLFSSEEYIYQGDDGKVYDENGYLFEDWYSDTHYGLRMRSGGNWEDGWEVRQDVSCEELSVTTSGKKYLYNNRCKTCEHFRKDCSYL